MLQILKNLKKVNLRCIPLNDQPYLIYIKPFFLLFNYIKKFKLLKNGSTSIKSF